jgi:hypothetical protein
MNKFNAGQRIRAIAPCDGWTDVIGATGKVTLVDATDDKLPYLVAFDDPTLGFDGDGRLWCPETSLTMEADT